MKSPRAFWLMLALAAPLLGGCMTKALWQDDAFHEAWPGAAIQLANDSVHKDVLVCYNELSDRSDHSRPRAYYLFENEQRIDARQKPRFVDPARAVKLPAIPVFTAEPPWQQTAGLKDYAVASTNGTSFRLFAKDRELGEFYLPVYKDGVWRTEKALLMPLAVGADATIVGGYVGLLYWHYSNGFTVTP